ncbi:MAG TPA: ATP-binding protein [Granulicella sp.]
MNDVDDITTTGATEHQNDLSIRGTRLGALDADLVRKLRAVPILASLSDDRLVCLQEGELVHLKDREQIVFQGQQGHFFWMVLEGELNVSQVLPEGNEMSLHLITSGSAFGEVPLLANIPNIINIRSVGNSELVRLNEEGFWELMTTCPEVRKAILGNMALRVQKMQSVAIHQEKMASLGTLAAGLMHELNNPGAAARRAASQLRENLLRLHELTAKFSSYDLKREQKECMFELQEQALTAKPVLMNSLEQNDAEELLAAWMEDASVANAWKLAPTLVSIGIDARVLECAKEEFPGGVFSDALNWLEAMVSSMQLVGTIEESIGRVSDLVHAVKSYAYEGRGQRQSIDVNDSVHATLVILGHKFREKQITLEKEFAADLPILHTEYSGLNQIWTNLLDNAIDAVPQKGTIRIRTWAEPFAQGDGTLQNYICVSVADNGTGIPSTVQERIFDPFYTTKQVGVGTGLGLGIVHRIVEQFGGRILFSSEPGRTEFLVRIPSTPSC